MYSALAKKNYIHIQVDNGGKGENLNGSKGAGITRVQALAQLSSTGLRASWQIQTSRHSCRQLNVAFKSNIVSTAHKLKYIE